MTICPILSSKFRAIEQMVGRGYKEYLTNTNHKAP